MSVYSIPGRVEVNWDSSVRAIIDTWIDYSVTLEEFREAVLTQGLEHAKANNGQAWIVDSSQAKGNFTADCQKFISTDIFPAFAANGIKYFITIRSKSALTNMTIKNYESKAGPHGLQLIEADSAQGAIAWLKANT